MNESLKVILDVGAYGLFAFMYFDLHKKNMNDIRNEELDRREQQRHMENMTEMRLLREDLNKLILTFSGKFTAKINYVDLITLKYREMQLFFYAKVDGNNIEKNLSAILSETEILVDDKINDLERLIRLSSNDSLSKEITDSVKPFFQEYGEYIKKLFHYFRENHKAGETKRSISNLTSSYIQKCREILEPE